MGRRAAPILSYRAALEQIFAQVQLTQLYQLAVDNPVFGERQPENASRIKGTQSQIVCSVDLVPFFSDANQRTSSASCSCDTIDASKTVKSIATGTLSRTSAVPGRKVVQRQVLYLGEINDSQFEAWYRLIEAFDEGSRRHRQLALFPADRELPACADGYGVKVRLDAMELHRPRQWGACWLACHLYEKLELDRFWSARLPNSRQGTQWRHILQTLVCYRLIDPGSEWRLHRQWFEQSAMADLLGVDYALVEKNALYRCLDKLLEHKTALFGHLRQRWQNLFGARFEVLLYDLTSTYFESSLPDDEDDKRRYGYSRDKRSDCAQVVIALIVTPEGLPLAYEVLPGNTADCTTLRGALRKIETQYGKADRIGVIGSRHSDWRAVCVRNRRAQRPGDGNH
jgi:hypothetical protein